MKKLIIDKMGLEQFEDLEEVVEFYPHGLKGLVTDYLAHYLKGPTVLEETEEDKKFFSRVLDFYDTATPEQKHNYGGDMSQVVAMLLVVKVSDIVRQIVQQYGCLLKDGVFDPSLVDWGQGHLTAPMRN